MTADTEIDSAPLDPGGFFALYREAAGWGAEYELRLRLLADKTPAIASIYTANSAEEAEEAIINHFSCFLALDEPRQMRTTRRLRNKLLHGDLIEARARLEQLGHGHGPTTVRTVALDPTLGPTEQVRVAVAGGGQYLSQDTHPIQGNIVAWLIQSAVDGTFTRAGNSFRSAINIIDRLACVEVYPS